MKKLGIIAAVQPELEAIQKIMTDMSVTRIYDLDFYEGTIGSIDCIVVQCGVGKVNAARTAQLMIDRFAPAYMVNVGTAGALSSTLNVGDIIIAQDLVQHDFDRSALGNPIGQIPNLDSVYIKSDPHLLMLCQSCFERISSRSVKSQTQIATGTIVTGDIFKISAKKRDELQSLFGALCIEMEGAAIAHVCVLDDIPFIVIRSISNGITGGTQDEDEFWKYRAVAAAQCADFIGELCEQLTDRRLHL